MIAVVQLLIPIGDTAASRNDLSSIRDELSEKFGGVTVFASAPAEGVWAEGGQPETDRLILMEVMVDDVDLDWWKAYRLKLEQQLRQEELVIRSVTMERL